MAAPPSSSSSHRQPASGSKRERSPAQIREFELRVWDLAKNLIHPAFVYATCQVAMWCAFERNGAFAWPHPGFWWRTGIHAIQFLGAWAVFYGTLLRDMLVETVTPTVIAWIAVVGTVIAWTWPSPRSELACVAYWVILGVQLATALTGWGIAAAQWFRSKRRYLAEHPEEDA